MRITQFLAALIMLSPSLVHGAEGSAAAPSWSNAAEFGIVVAAGNSETTQLALRDVLTRSWRASQLVLDAAALRTKGRRRVLSNESGVLELLYNIEEARDLRANMVTSLEAALNGSLALKTSYSVRYDNRPVTETLHDPAAPSAPGAAFEFDRFDGVFATSLVVNF